jgi:hypothetical protein
MKSRQQITSLHSRLASVRGPLATSEKSAFYLLCLASYPAIFIDKFYINNVKVNTNKIPFILKRNSKSPFKISRLNSSFARSRPFSNGNGAQKMWKNKNILLF